MQAAASFFPLEKCRDSDNLHSCGEDSTLCSGVLDPQSLLWTRYWGGVLGQAAPPWVWYPAASVPSLGIHHLLAQGCAEQLPLAPSIGEMADLTISPNKAPLSVIIMAPRAARRHAEHSGQPMLPRLCGLALSFGGPEVPSPRLPSYFSILSLIPDGTSWRWTGLPVVLC